MLGFFIVDFYCSEIKVAIEIDGDVHDDRGEYDDERTIELNKLGIKVIRYTNEEVLSDIQKVYSYLKEEFMFLCNENDNPSQPLEPLPAS
jgi:very-short-patch-repair endonuclease